MKTSRKILLSLGALGAAASIAGLGTYATFTDSESVSQTISSGTVNIALGASGPDNRFSVSATGMVPGDTAQRRLKITNPTTPSATTAQNLASITLSTAASTSSVLDTDGTNGLHMLIEKCTDTITGVSAWVESASTPYTYTCPVTATRATVVARRAIIIPSATPASMAGMSALTVGNTDDLVVTVDLPTGADNTFQGKTSTIDYTFVGTQRAATDK